MVAATSSDMQINLVVLRGADQQTLQVPGGLLGIVFNSVRKGIPNVANKMFDLPAATPATVLDFSVLKSHPHQESWYTLGFADQAVGALYIDVLAHGKYIQWTFEKSSNHVNDDYPRTHFITRVITTFSDHPQFIRSDEINVLTGGQTLQTLRRFDAGKKCELVVRNSTSQDSMPFTVDPQQLVLCRLITFEMLQFMPRAKDRCVHFQYYNFARCTVEEGALHVIDVDPSTADDKNHSWNAEAVFQGLFPILGTLDAHGHLVSGTYANLDSGPMTYASSSEEAATAGLDGKLALVCPFDSPDHLPDDDLVK